MAKNFLLVFEFYCLLVWWLMLLFNNGANRPVVEFKPLQKGQTGIGIIKNTKQKYSETKIQSSEKIPLKNQTFSQTSISLPKTESKRNYNVTSHGCEKHRTLNIS